MRKKLLALLMCATMVLGTAVTASAYTDADVTTAKGIVKQFAKFNEEFTETAAKAVTFSTQYSNVNTGAYATFKYGFYGDASKGLDMTESVKLNKDGKALTKVEGDKLEAKVDSNSFKDVTQFVVDAATLAKATDKKNDVIRVTDGGATHLYYISSVVPATVGDTPAKGSVVITTNVLTTGRPYAGGELIVTVKPYTAETTAIAEYPAKTSLDDTVYGIDVDGYINLASDDQNLVKMFDTLVDGYWAYVGTAEEDTLDIAEAVSKKTITKDAVAINVKLYQVTNFNTLPVKGYGNAVAMQGTFKQLTYCVASRNSESANVKADWLSRTSLKKADGVSVYVLDEFVPAITEYFQKVGTVYKVADVKDGKFSPDYLVSGTYIFDVAAAAADNAGKTDADATKPAADSSASPKTGDVAPIAALAVVMMGAFGAMVVASKKRA